MTTMTPFTIAGNIVDVHQHRIFYGSIRADQGIIADIEEIDEQERAGEPYLLPGFIDSHVHIESSMLTPSEFARLAVTHGTVATVSDPHEIANVCGRKGVDFMIQNGKLVNFKFYFGAPSCVPATVFETAGGALRPEEVRRLLSDKDIRYLSEMMNFPGVLANDPEAMEKIQAAHLAGKPVDGHAPGLRGEALARYAAAGISTDHECFTREEALDKLRQGMKILIREGSAAKNFDALISLLSEYPKQMMFCSDDKHPDSLTRGHINELCRRAAEAGIPLFNILDAACVNPVVHYGLEVGLLRKGDPADFIVVEDLRSFAIRRTYINGELTAENGLSLIRGGRMPAINNFSCDLKKPADFSSPAPDYLLNNQLPVIEAFDGQLLTNCLWLEPKIEDGAVVSDIARDILKIAVVNRYTGAPPAIAFIRNFGLRSGAIASSVAHDSHNIIAVGSDDDSLCDAVNLIIETQGGISCLSGDERAVLPLPVAGLMSDDDGYLVADAYTRIDAMAKSLGSTLSAPFMTLSFMALLVIPSLKLSDLGLFDGARFQFVLPKDRLR